MERLLNPDELLSELRTRVLLDVRSPGEYAQGHIPGALSFPLFTDEERARVGTIY
ncbi:MAG TPA: rhodanese-like domain-containing protein, partial [Saprospiraceae bacterium]|nr:rhodanese-like domain-containing protein [Saprospiraceae bacterium]